MVAELAGWVVGRSDAAEHKKNKQQNNKTLAGTTPPAITRPGSFMTPFGVPPLTLICTGLRPYLQEAFPQVPGDIQRLLGLK